MRADVRRRLRVLPPNQVQDRSVQFRRRVGSPLDKEHQTALHAQSDFCDQEAQERVGEVHPEEAVGEAEVPDEEVQADQWV